MGFYSNKESVNKVTWIVSTWPGYID